MPASVTMLGPGERFGRLRVVCYVPVHERPEKFLKAQRTEAVFEFMCDCGQPLMALGANVTKGMTQSCGCLRNERRWPERIAPLEVFEPSHEAPRPPPEPILIPNEISV